MDWKKVLYALILAAVAAASALGGVLAGGLAVYRAMRSTQGLPAILAPTTSASSTTPIPNLQIDTLNIETNITQAVEKVGPAVVTVVAQQPNQLTPFGLSQGGEVSGSGVIFSDQGYILTNNHVVEGATSVSVILSDGTSLEAQVIGTDRYADLGVLRASGKMPAVASLGNSDTLKPGETVIAIGSPLGEFRNTVTSGVVSATHRNLDTGEGYQLEDLIQTDAAINHGNSGGPLVNLAGEVVGINTLIVRSDGTGSDVAEGLGFAIPANTISAVASQLIDHGKVSRPYLGIQWEWITPQIAEFYNLPVQWGVYITQIDRGSPAQDAGLRRGDIIYKVGGIALDNNHPYINALFNHAPGETIELDVQRGRQSLQVQVTLGEQGNR